MEELLKQKFNSDSEDEEYIPTKAELEESKENKIKNKKDQKVIKSKVDAFWEKMKQKSGVHKENLPPTNSKIIKLDEKLESDKEKEKKLEEEIRNAIKNMKEQKEKTVTKEYFFAGQKFEEKNAYLHSFDNNPQFQKMLKSVGKQLLVIFIMGILVCIFSGIAYFYITNRKNGVSLKLGLLNDPNLSKAFRLFVIIEFLILIGSFVINIIVVIMINEYFEKKSNLVKLITYTIFCLISVLFIIGFKYCFSLFFESILILLNKKTEYSILMINEQNGKSELLTF